MDFSSAAPLANQRRIVDRRELVEQLDAVAGNAGDPSAVRVSVLNVLKAALEAGRLEVRQRFDREADTALRGHQCVQAHCFLVDQIVRVIYDFAYERVYPVANPTEGEKQAIVAVGGYGRGELAPQSDIDLLFLSNWKLTPHAEQIVEFLLYTLWDLGLKVGHATRSIDECIRLAKSDLTIRTALLEARYLWGDAALYRGLRQKFRDFTAAEGDNGFVTQKLAERDVRHAKLGDSRYVLEPNIKDGKGGLRDLHTLFWIAKNLYRVDAIGDLVDRNVFSDLEAGLFRKAHAFLTTVRCHMHYLTGRPEERLTFDVQPEIARLMGYGDRKTQRGVERFMRRYYLVAKDVGDLTRIFCAALEDETKRRPWVRLPGRLSGERELGDFVVRSGRLNTKSEEVIRRDPANMLRLFETAQIHRLDIHPSALRQITQSLKSIDNAVREDPAANASFLAMLTSKNDPAGTLKRLNEAGVMGRFIPDFGRVVAQMQHDMYHVYTVDEHTIRAVGLLHRIETGDLAEDHPLATEIVHKVASRRALYVAVLMHDIAKGRGGDHSVIGAELALDLCPRLGLDSQETETVAWLVRYHLVMSNTAQKRDIDDPKTIRDFADHCQSPERLRLLLVLTVADMRATGPAVWNGWKAALLRELYYRTEELLSGSIEADTVAARVARAKDAVAARLADWPSEDIEAFLELGYTAYWLSLDSATQARHAALTRSAHRDNAEISIDVGIDEKRSVTEVTVYTPDHPGLFSQIAGAMALFGASIVEARIFTLANGHALDIFTIQNTAGKAVSDPRDLERLKNRIANSLTGELRPWRELVGRESLPRRARDVFEVPPRVLIDNTASNFFSVIEVNGRDRPGLLHDVTRALTECGLQIGTAKISTYGERVVDVFYVKDVFGMKITNAQKQEEVRKAVLMSLSAEPEYAAA
ncbi:MAG: [protein-PII] uridylyltransferase [Rhodospirillaceae bacterium]|nr:[protein-PII] uridylyltransferase [Rhodospirillaceae bacterium]MYF86146.1 [protein-PII] uridylyltransferase [Rhodospirillaceae bacterium]MYH38306.1 [protein-PII] uridylyltransferase [Rhodospirillaceae bacterium]MYK16255.1 [protein-PII] uridylyltransferase [Rhodospirillaceae bacterium]